jgi:hypothetical protein
MTDHAPSPRATAHLEEEAGESISLAHLAHTLRRYRAIMLLALAIIMVGYAVVATAAYLLAPAQRITALPFRLDFEGATKGEYPNKIKFSPAEITATPVLLRVFQDDALGRFLDREEFERSVFVLESNREYERLVAEYQAKLADPRLTPVDRSNIEREFDVKRGSLNKSGYSLNYAESAKRSKIPPVTLEKVLSDVLATWARQAAVEKRVLDYRNTPLSLNTLKSAAVVNDDYVISLVILRSRINDLVANIEQLSKIPGVELVRTSSTHASLEEVGLEIRDTTRFRIDPLVARARSGGLARNWADTLRILTSQLDYDTRALEAAQQRENALKEALDIYQQEHRIGEPNQSASATKASASRPSGETVMPQISESFLDRVVDLANQTGDRQYRQDLVDQIKKAALETVPLQTEVRNDQQLVNDFKSAPPRVAAASKDEVEAIRNAWIQVYGDIGRSIGEINEIYTIASRQLNPSTELYSKTGPPSSRVDRGGVSMPRLLLYGLLVFLISVPLVVGSCLIHNRIGEEEGADAIELGAAANAETP